MPLTDKRIRAAKPCERTYRLADERALYLEVTPRGGRYWRLKYRFGGREKRLALGVYPDISLAEARTRRDAARTLLAHGVDPSEARKAEKRGLTAAEAFESIAREWFSAHAPTWAPSHANKVIGRLEREIFPWLGSRPLGEITPSILLETLRRIESRGHHETARRTHQAVSRVFRYAIATGRADRDPAADLRGALKPASGRRMASLTEPSAVGALLRAIDGYQGHFPTMCALRLAPLVFVRPGELRAARWDELALKGDNPEWRIPASRMKMKAQHIVPLSAQAIAILCELRPLTGPDGYVFPSVRSKDRPMSENTVNAALRRLGYTKDEMTGHGFRSTASSLLNEQGWNRDAIERQLAHGERSKVRAAYNYAEYLPERRRMMQAWADYLDSLRAGDAVVPLRPADV